MLPPRIWKSSEIKLLGQMSDKKVALQLGCADHQVARRRERLGIRPFRQLPRRKSWTAAEDKLLGALPDKDLAAKLGRTLNAVHIRRREFGIRYVNPKRKTWTEEEVALLGK